MEPDAAQIGFEGHRVYTKGGMMAAADWLPYCGAAPEPAELLSRWNIDPMVLGVLGLAAVCVSTHLRGRDRTLALTMLGLLAILFVSPFCALTSALFSARVTHHLILTAVAAPMLAYALPLKARGGVPLWAVLHMLAFWLWHAPTPYGWALSSDALYWLMQLSLFGTGFALWSAIRHAPPPLGVGALLATTVQMGLLAALITFAADPLYAPHLVSTYPWGLAPTEDQQLAGLIMWAPGCALYLLAALALLGRWLARERTGALAT